MSPSKHPDHILLRRQTDAIADKDLAFFQLALQLQLRDLCKAYRIRPIGVTLVSPDTHLPQHEAAGIDFVDDDGLDASVAHHGHLPGANFTWSLVGVKESPLWTVSGSHEGLEMAINPRLDQYVVGPEDWRWPKEVADMVEDHSYPISVSLMGETRDVQMSNYVLPAFWHIDSRGPWDAMRVLRRPFDVAEGGYALVERNGYLVQVGASARRARKRQRSRVDWLRDQTWPGR